MGNVTDNFKTKYKLGKILDSFAKQKMLNSSLIGICYIVDTI